VEHVVVPLARAFAPQLVLISAGYDAHRDDPLAGCTVTEAGFAAMTTVVRQVASELEAPVGVALEGGYALGPLARSVAATLEALADAAAPAAPTGVAPLASDARARLARWWPALA
jgi:acetoin utilization deacetylase AcuC-like enzyme